MRNHEHDLTVRGPTRSSSGTWCAALAIVGASACATPGNGGSAAATAPAPSEAGAPGEPAAQSAPLHTHLADGTRAPVAAGVADLHAQEFAPADQSPHEQTLPSAGAIEAGAARARSGAATFALADASPQPVLTAPGEPAAATQASAPEAAGDPYPIHGSLSSRYRLRSTSGARDQDLYETLVLDVGDARTAPVTAHFMGRMSWDMDGIHDADSKQVFPSLSDTGGDELQGLLYEAYVDVQRPPAVGALRVGRQIDYMTPEFAFFDGVSLASKESAQWKLTGGAYGGVPSRLWDTPNSGDALYGLWGEGRPWKGGRLRLDWMHVDEDARLGPYDDDLYGLSAWQRCGEKLGFDGRYTRLEGDDRDVRLRANWNDAEADWLLQADWFRLLSTQRDFANEFDPFYSSLQDYFPFDQFRAQTSKGLGEHTRVDGGIDLRRVSDSGDEGAYNHDYDRGWLSLVLLDLFADGLSFTLTGDKWNSDDQDIDTWGFDVSRKLESGYEFSLGSSFALYKYDYFLDRERDDVRDYYLRLRKKQSESWTFDARYDYEDDDGDAYHVLMLGATWRF